MDLASFHFYLALQPSPPNKGETELVYCRSWNRETRDPVLGLSILRFFARGTRARGPGAAGAGRRGQFLPNCQTRELRQLGVSWGTSTENTVEPGVSRNTTVTSRNTAAGCFLHQLAVRSRSDVSSNFAGGFSQLQGQDWAKTSLYQWRSPNAVYLWHAEVYKKSTVGEHLRYFHA